MQNNFKNPFGNSDIGQYYKRMYSNNKLLIWISLAFLFALFLSGAGFINSFFTAYLVFISGVLFRQYFMLQKLIYTLIMGLVAGLAFYLTFFISSFNLADALMAAAGSSAFALLAATATYAPNGYIMLAFMGRVKLKWIAIILIGLDLITVNFSTPSPRLSHLAGAIYGFLSIYLLTYRSFGNGFNFWNLFRKPGPYYKRPSKKQSTYTPPKAAREKDDEYNARKIVEQKEIDKILEKIKQSGYETLSSEEKKKLFDQSNR
jgi:hypothetical protein